MKGYSVGFHLQSCGTAAPGFREVTSLVCLPRLALTAAQSTFVEVGFRMLMGVVVNCVAASAATELNVQMRDMSVSSSGGESVGQTNGSSSRNSKSAGKHSIQSCNHHKQNC